MYKDILYHIVYPIMDCSIDSNKCFIDSYLASYIIGYNLISVI